MKTRASLLALSLLATGCGTLYPEDPLFVYGRALHADGTPLAGTTLMFERKTAYDGSTPTVSVFEPFREVTTEPDGSYTLELLVKETRSQVRDYSFSLHAFRLHRQEEDGSESWLGFNLHGGDVELPALLPWQADLHTTPTADGVMLALGAPLPTLEIPPSATSNDWTIIETDGSRHTEPNPSPPSLWLELRSGDGILWWSPSPKETLAVSRSILEDFAAPVARTSVFIDGDWTFKPMVSLNDSYLSFYVEWASASVALPSGGLVPVSRGAACEPFVDTCPLTDGKLETIKSVPLNELRVRLPTPKKLRQAVVRGFASAGHTEAVVVEGSVDGQEWTVLGRATLETRRRARNAQLTNRLGMERFLDVPLAPEAPAVTQVRLRVVGEGLMNRADFRELSLFE
ncbi:hypothetical protein JRI60_08500 [Archangium violaceum]|uniref:hypothetical protein n=1 Tax=Archangium violaceum TaxID=83451 RepID=UPI00194EF85F|nr:hypothetical protein [Archangium violaceum]QRN99047.1 hypothetical protein JRI60_08500 [Archangium violaceum]